MNLFTRALSKIFKSGNQQELNKIKPILQKINDLEPEVSKLKEDDFKKRLTLSSNLLITEEILKKYCLNVLR